MLVLSETVKAVQCTNSILTKKKDHEWMVSSEKLTYQCNRDRARRMPQDYWSIIVDGADKSAFGLPHFKTSIKSVREHSMKVKLLGVLGGKQYSIQDDDRGT